MILRVAVALLIVGAITAFDLGHSNLLEKRDSTHECFQQLDIVFIIDASSSIWSQNFTKAKKFVVNFVDGFDIGQNRVRVALEKYGDKVYVDEIIHFQDFDDKESLQKHISSLIWNAGSRTETGMGISYMTDNIMSNARPGIPRICVVITDGKSQEPNKTAKYAKIARKAGIDMFAIGVSKAVSREELESIAGSADRVIIVDTYSELENKRDELIRETCIDVQQNPTAPTCLPTDIYYVFDPANIGMDTTAWVTQFITHSLTFAEGHDLRFGVISGSCPLDAGFNLDTYSTFDEVRTRVQTTYISRLPTLIQSLHDAHSVARGGRSGGRKVAVIFVGGKVDAVAVIKAAKQAKEAGIKIFLSGTNNVQNGLLDALVEENIGFNLAEIGTSARRQAEVFINQVCGAAE